MCVQVVHCCSALHLDLTQTPVLSLERTIVQLPASFGSDTAGHRQRNDVLKA